MQLRIIIEYGIKTWFSKFWSSHFHYTLNNIQLDRVGDPSQEWGKLVRDTKMLRDVADGRRFMGGDLEFR